MTYQTFVTIDEYDDGALVIPPELIEKLGWKEGDDVAVEVVGGRIVVTKVP